MTAKMNSSDDLGIQIVCKMSHDVLKLSNAFVGKYFVACVFWHKETNVLDACPMTRLLVLGTICCSHNDQAGMSACARVCRYHAVCEHRGQEPLPEPPDCALLLHKSVTDFLLPSQSTSMSWPPLVSDPMIPSHTWSLWKFIMFCWSWIIANGWQHLTDLCSTGILAHMALQLACFHKCSVHHQNNCQNNVSCCQCDEHERV